MSPKKRAVILLSGGVDSVTTLYFILERGYTPYALVFDYGQRHRREINYACKIARLTKTPYHIVKINLKWCRSSLTQRSIKVPQLRDLNKKDIPSTYVSARNIIFLSYAFSFAESIGAKYIFIGAHIQDYSGYPDCRPEFLKSFERAANLGMANPKIKIEYPLINKNKREIIKLGLKLKVPFEYTWSCYEGKDKPCLMCDSCRYRINAFKSLGIDDPLLSQ